MKKNPVERTLERALNIFQAVREKRESQRTDPVKTVGAALMGAAVGWATWKKPKKTDKDHDHQDMDQHNNHVVAASTQQTGTGGSAKAAGGTGKAGDEAAEKVDKDRKAPLPLEKRKRFAFTPRAIFELLKETLNQWTTDKAPQLAAALAYYTIFSLGPLLILIIAIVGLVYSQQGARDQIMGQITNVVGSQGADFIKTLLDSASKPSSGIIATILGLLALFGGVVGVMGQLKNALNTIWNVTPPKGPGGIKGIFWSIRKQFLSFTLVLGIGFLLLVSLVLSAAITAVGNYFNGRVPEFLYQTLEFVLSFGVITVLFAAIYKVLPDAKIAWRDVWIGAALTSLLFTIGKLLLGLYLGRSSVASSYGAAGSLVVVMLWVYYSAQILFFGAELTQVYANQYGDHIVVAESEAQAKAQKSQAQGQTQQASRTPSRQGAR